MKEVVQQKENKPKKSQKKPAPKPVPAKSKELSLSREEIKALIKDEVFNLLPDLKKELGIVEEPKVE